MTINDLMLLKHLESYLKCQTHPHLLFDLYISWQQRNLVSLHQSTIIGYMGNET